jgi:cell division septation protein DedD
MRRRWLLLLLVVGLAGAARAQGTSDEIRQAIAKVEQGRAEDVKRSLPELAAKYQNDPGVLYLQGRLASDGIEGVKFYQSIVDNFPKSEYADDALYHIYQYYYALGLYRTAELKMQALKKDYPDSPYATGQRAQAQLPAVEEPSVRVAAKDDTAAAAPSAAPPAGAPAGTPALPPAVPPARKAPYTLQTGAFSTAANAEKQKNFFEDKGLTVEVTNKVRGGRSLFLVWVGSYASADEAKRFGREVRSKYNIDSIVVERY